MKLKYKGKEIEVPNDFMLKCGAHAEQRGMTLEEYIAVAFTILEHNNSNSCGGTPEGWIPEEEFKR